MSAFPAGYSQMMIRTSIILLYLMKILKCDIEETTQNQINEPNLRDLQNRVLLDVQLFRNLHEVPQVTLDYKLSNLTEDKAQRILDRPEGDTRIPSVKGKYPPDEGYFPLISIMRRIPCFEDFMHKRDYNPIYKWYGYRMYYTGHYNKTLHRRYGFYTQLIWKASSSIGIGIASRKNSVEGWDFVLYINFAPSGNNGNFEGNVLPAKHHVPYQIEPFGPLDPDRISDQDDPYNDVATVSGQRTVTFAPNSEEEAARRRIRKDLIRIRVASKIFRYINRLRGVHGVPPLKIGTKKMYDVSNKLVSNLAITRHNTYENRNGYAPNSYMAVLAGSGIQSLIEDPINPSNNVVLHWYRTKKYYNGSFNMTNHVQYMPFTTMIWRESRRVAISIYHHTDNNTAVVAHFDPPGSQYDGDYDTNVLQPNVLTHL